MTKNILLAAAALSVMAFAGGAAAQVQITGAKVSGQALGVSAGTTDSVYTVAAESNGTEANRTTTAVAGDNVIASVLKTGVFEAGAAGTTYSATITLTGAVFANPVLNADVAVTGNTGTCVIAPATVVSGGATGQNTATVVFTVPNTCSSTGANVAPNGVSFDVPFIKNTGTGGVSASISYGVSTTGAAFGGAAGSANLVQVMNGYSVYARANPVAGAAARKLTTFALPSYTNLVAVGGDYDRTIGAVSASLSSPLAASAGAVNNTVYANMAAAAMPAITATVSVSGDLSLLTATAGALPLVVNSAKTSTATASDVAVAPTDITVVKNADAATTPVTAPQSFTATVTPVVAANTLVTTPAAVTGALETVGQQGTSFLAPWVQSTNANYNTVIRVSNSGAAVTGGVRLSLSSPVGTASATQCTSAELPKLASIPANGELSINSADLTTCFGAFTRGDVRVTIPALTSNLSAKLRIVNPGNIVAEQSLGAIAQGVATTQ